MITGRELALDPRVTSPFAAELYLRLMEPKPTTSYKRRKTRARSAILPSGKCTTLSETFDQPSKGTVVTL